MMVLFKFLRLLIIWLDFNIWLFSFSFFVRIMDSIAILYNIFSFFIGWNIIGVWSIYSDVIYVYPNCLIILHWTRLLNLRPVNILDV